MNHISIRPARTKYIPERDTPIIFIDNAPLDVLVAAAAPGLDTEGMLPFASGTELFIDHDIFKKRLSPEVGSTTVAPMLLCPDCMDVFCTTIVAELERTGQQYIWHRTGLDKSPQKPFDTGDPDHPSFVLPDIGSQVEWFDEMGPMRFSVANFEEAMGKLIKEAEDLRISPQGAAISHF